MHMHLKDLLCHSVSYSLRKMKIGPLSHFISLIDYLLTLSDIGCCFPILLKDDIPLHETKFCVLGKKFLSLEEISCHRKKGPVSGFVGGIPLPMLDIRI